MRIWIQLLCQETWSSRKPTKTPGLRRQFHGEDGSGGSIGNSSRRSSRVSKEVDNRGSPECLPPSQKSSINRGLTRHTWTGTYEAHLWDSRPWKESQKEQEASLSTWMLLMMNNQHSELKTWLPLSTGGPRNSDQLPCQLLLQRSGRNATSGYPGKNILFPREEKAMAF